MATDLNQTWFVYAPGVKPGPYTSKQIEELLQSGKVHGQNLVSAEHLNGKWISVSELIKTKKTDFTPPPRPIQQTTQLNDINTAESSTDPTLSLF
ncbi:MAG: hypothetical protein AAB116_16960, partial [Candidatus Poribacteria bacterium]